MRERSAEASYNPEALSGQVILSPEIKRMMRGASNQKELEQLRGSERAVFYDIMRELESDSMM